jgi:hypothetical protein
MPLAILVNENNTCCFERFNGHRYSLGATVDSSVELLKTHYRRIRKLRVEREVPLSPSEKRPRGFHLSYRNHFRGHFNRRRRLKKSSQDGLVLVSILVTAPAMMC